MPEDIGGGLHLAGAGMGLVFLALLAFLLIMVALQRLFPEKGVLSEDLGPGGWEDTVGEATITEPAETPQAAVGQSSGGLPQAQIAAMAVALYLSMEQGDSGGQLAVTTPASVPMPSPGVSNWSVRGKTLLMENQSRRPPPYGQKLHSAYPQRNESR